MQLFQKEFQEFLDNDQFYNTAWQYYEGGVPEVFATSALRQALRGTANEGGLNYARTVVREMTNRLEVNSVVATTRQASKIIDKVSADNNLDMFFDDLFEKASVYGQSFALAWPDTDGAWHLTAHTPREMFMVYDDENPWVKEAAVRVWQKDENTVRMNVFYADRIVKYSCQSQILMANQDWTYMSTEENPFGEVPVFHLRNNGDEGRPEHLDAYPAQDNINKLIGQHLYTVDYQGMPQRYALAQVGDNGEAKDFDEDAEDRENIESVKSGPGELWYLKGVTSVGEFKAANPNTFWDPIRFNVSSMASLTDTPLHYFSQEGGLPSGPSLRAAEAPLLTKVKKRRNAYGMPLKRLFEFILRQENVATFSVEIKWADLESIDELEEWDLYLKKRNAGLPMRQVLVEAGYTKEEIDQIFQWKIDESQQLAEVTDYQRKPVVRVETQNDENNVEEGELPE